MEIQTHNRTAEEFATARRTCRELFRKKLHDYGTSWRVMRLPSLTDQIYIKARRIRSIEEKGHSCIDEGIEPEFIGIVNYCAIALIQAERDCSDSELGEDEARRHMRVSSFTDIILQKLLRTKEIEDHDGKTLVSEGVEANYMDMINYSLFALIKLQERKRDGDGCQCAQ